MNGDLTNKLGRWSPKLMMITKNRIWLYIQKMSSMPVVSDLLKDMRLLKRIWISFCKSQKTQKCGGPQMARGA